MGKEPGFASKVVGSLAAVVAVKWMAKVDEDSDIPRVVRANERSVALVARALELVEAHASDADAVAQLVSLGGGRRGDLKTASAMARQDGRWTELADTNRVVRLLDAATSGRPVSPPRPEHENHFAPLGRLAALPPETAFAELKGLVPELGDIEREITRATGLGGVAGLEALRPARHRLRRLVGPGAESDDVVIRSAVARDQVWTQLVEAARPTGQT